MNRNENRGYAWIVWKKVVTGWLLSPFLLEAVDS